MRTLSNQRILEKLGLPPSPYGGSRSFHLYFNPLAKLKFLNVLKKHIPLRT